MIFLVEFQMIVDLFSRYNINTEEISRNFSELNIHFVRARM